MYYCTFVITYANPCSQIGWWELICITTVRSFLSNSITDKSLTSDTYLSLVPNQRTNICNKCDYGNLWLYNHWNTDSNWFQFLFLLVRESVEQGSSRWWAAPHSDESLALGTLRERESTGFVKRVIIFQKHFTKSILPEAFCFAGDLSREAFPGSIFLAGACL